MSDRPPSSSPSPTPTPVSPSPANPLKRKDHPDGDDDEPTDERGSQAPDSPAPEQAQTGKRPSSTAPLPVGANAHPDEYEAGFVICQTCGTEVSFRDDANGFTTKHWDAHKQTCPAPSASTSSHPNGVAGQMIYAAADPSSASPSLSHNTHGNLSHHPSQSHSNAHARSSHPHSSHHHSSSHSQPHHSGTLSHHPVSGIPPAKRRRAKRTEEERIEYLRADPYVGQFEAYRVLCASCDKWIRLRPNSTYCSIPWDAHRKSCLAKKVNNKNVYGLEERNALFSKDPDVRKFDPERILCNMCDKWIALPPEDHLQAVQKWLQHRAGCRGGTGVTQAPAHPSTSSAGADAGPPVPAGPSSSTSGPAPPAASAGDANAVRHSPDTTSSPTSPKASTAAGPPPPLPTRYPPLASPPSSHAPHPSSAHQPHSTSHPLAHGPSFHDLTPSTYAPAHESRRRNAEQRAATLRADRLIGEVEPNRVFCSLCEKWVQLRQDSSYCAYPWLQHRGKCLARYQRRSQKAAEIADMKSHTRKGPYPSSSHSSYPSHHPHPSSHPSHSLHHGHPSHPSNGHPGRSSMEEDELMSDGDGPPPPSHGRYQQPRRSEDLESEEGADSMHEGERKRPGPGGGRGYYTSGPKMYHHHPPSSAPYSHHHRGSGGGEVHRSRGMPYPHPSAQGRYPGPSNGYSPNSSRPSSSRAAPSSSRGWDRDREREREREMKEDPDADADADADGEPDADADAEGEYLDEEGSEDVKPITGHGPTNGKRRMSLSATGSAGMGRSSATSRRPQWSTNGNGYGPVDLDSVGGRKQFIASSIYHLFNTTFTPSEDELTISALLAYLNAAMPQDKFEDFDTTEVARAVAGLKERGRVLFEGDGIRLVE